MLQIYFANFLRSDYSFKLQIKRQLKRTANLNNQERLWQVAMQFSPLIFANSQRSQAKINLRGQTQKEQYLNHFGFARIRGCDKTMANNGTANTGLANTQGLSKRELKKLNQTLRLIEKQTNSNDRSHKRNGQHYRKAHEGTPRKILKTQALINGEKSQDGSSSVRESIKETEEQHQKTQNVVEEPQQKVYNSAYNIEGGQSGLFNYILSYNYNQKNAQMEMQDEDWNCLQEIGEEELIPLQNQRCKKATKKTIQRFAETRKRLSHLYSREYKDFSKKYLTSAYLLGP